MTVIDWMMAYPYLSVIIVIVGLLTISTMSFEIRLGSTDKGVLGISDSSKKNQKENVRT